VVSRKQGRHGACPYIDFDNVLRLFSNKKGGIFATSPFFVWYGSVWSQIRDYSKAEKEKPSQAADGMVIFCPM
jgi:hypothetical protein